MLEDHHATEYSAARSDKAKNSEPAQARSTDCHLPHDNARKFSESPLRDLHQNTSYYLTTFNSGELKHSTN